MRPPGAVRLTDCWGPGAGGGGEESVFHGDRVSDEKVLETDGGDVNVLYATELFT